MDVFDLQLTLGLSLQLLIRDIAAIDCQRVIMPYVNWLNELDPDLADLQVCVYGHKLLSISLNFVYLFNVSFLQEVLLYTFLGLTVQHAEREKALLWILLSAADVKHGGNTDEFEIS